MIRGGNYQYATVAEPLSLHGWQLIDEANRALAGMEWSGYVAPTHLATKDNIGSKDAWSSGEWEIGARIREAFGYGPWWTGYGSFPA